jgi:HEPN domain-containing protein
MSGETELARQWLAKAKNDLLCADNNLKADETPFDTVCFHCQQAAEKILKAFLIAKGQPYPPTHDLLLMLEKVLPISPDAENIRDALAILTPYAVEVRYLDESHIPSQHDAVEARDAAAQVFKWLNDALPHILQDAEEA